MTDANLAARCQALIDGAQGALSWASNTENAETIGVAQRDLTRNMRRILRRSTKLNRALDRNTSVSVFGPSQAGKSFLVSVLARPQDGPLIAEFSGGDTTLDYIRDINPEGEGESTGLVTRFTMDRPNCPKGFPVQLNLMSESDIIRTLINSFCFDGNNAEPTPEISVLSQHLATFRQKAAAAPQPGLVVEDVWDIEEYVKRIAARLAYFAPFVGIWDDIVDIAPRLSRADRASFFAVLWGGHGAITQLYLQLTEALDQLGHAEIIHSSVDALTPKEQSIIDVKTLHRLYDGNAAETVDVLASNNVRASIGKPVLCALTAELLIPMQERPHDFMGHTDLLDFPGARTRFEQPLDEKLKAEDEVTELLLRGKVAFLFDRYVADQEITSMLLCVADSNMEVDSLPSLIDNWINETIGTDPKVRAERENILFFVMTKFDKHLSDTAASSDDHARFDRRIQASLLEKFGRSSDKWVENWGPGQSFNNCYWLRNPNYFLEAFFDYDTGKRETPRADKADRLSKLKEGYLQAAEVQKHFHAPERAWDAAMSANDGGITHLVEEMTKVCRPGVKQSQVAVQLQQLSQILLGMMEPYYISDDFEKRRDQKAQEVDLIINDLEAALEDGQFAAVLSALSVRQDDLRTVISEIPSDVRIIAATQSGTSTTQEAVIEKVRPRMRPGRSAATATAPDVQADPPAGIRSLSTAQFQAESAMKHWMSNLTDFRDSAAQELGVEAENAQNLKSELELGARRQSLLGLMIQKLETSNYGHTIEEQAPLAAMICSEVINRYIGQLGYDRLPADQRPKVQNQDGTDRCIFAPKPAFDDAVNLPKAPRPVRDELWTDWVFGLHEMALENAMSNEGQDINQEQNMHLSEVLAHARNASGQEVV